MPNPSFTRGEFWLLNAVIYFRLDIFRLATDNVGVLINKKHHNLSLLQINKDLMNLYNQGLIDVLIDETDTITKSVELTEDLIQYIFDNKPTELPSKEPPSKEPQIYYLLNTKGAEYWESFTRPNWKFFVFDGEETLNCDECLDGKKAINKVEIACQDKRLLHVYLDNFCNGEIDKSTIEWSKLDEFEVLYWKNLPNVHLLTFEYEEGYNEVITEEKSMKKSVAGHSQMVHDKVWCNWY